MNTLLPLLGTLGQIIAIAALADFLAGVVHWIEDAYFREDTPVIGPWLIKPNIVHHHLPRHFTKLSWWDSSKDLLAVGVIVLAAAFALDRLTWQVAFFVTLAVNANQVHKWAHQTRAENGVLISSLQDWGILQTPRHHGLHHTDPKNTFYCPITNFVNPVLERIQFWTRLEAVIEAVSGVRRREDTAVRGQGPGPAWLDLYRPQPRTTTTESSAAPRGSSCRQSCATCRGCALRRTIKTIRPCLPKMSWRGAASRRDEAIQLSRPARGPEPVEGLDRHRALRDDKPVSKTLLSAARPAEASRIIALDPRQDASSTARLRSKQ